MKYSCKQHPYVMAALFAMIITVIFNVGCILVFAYGDYLMNTNRPDDSGERIERVDRRRPAPPMKHIGRPDEMRHEGEVGNPDEMPRDIPVFRFLANLLHDFIYTFILFIICITILYRSKLRENRRVTLTAVTAVACILLNIWLTQLLTVPHHPDGPESMHFIRALSVVSIFLGIIVFFTSLLAYYINKGHEAAVENESLRALNYSSQYEALKSKINPHFLFNALNTVSSLAAINSEKTSEYIQKLSMILRASLSQEEITRLDEEINFAKAYGDLMTIRYEDSLTIRYEIPAEKRSLKTISFGIQTLLENAIKHNAISTRKPMEITVTAEDGYVVVSNPVSPRRDIPQGNGLGLSILSKRCVALLEKDIIIENDDTRFTVKIPVI